MKCSGFEVHFSKIIFPSVNFTNKFDALWLYLLSQVLFYNVKSGQKRVVYFPRPFLSYNEHL